MKRDLKDEYKNLFQKIRAILNDVDPESFNPGQYDGSPADEYDGESRSILNFVIHNQEKIKINNQILVVEINKIWQHYFGTECSKSEKIAQTLTKIIFSEKGT